jgi:hypothetical protein
LAEINILPLTALTGAAVPSGDDDDEGDTLNASSANALPDKVTKAHSDTTTDDLFTIISFARATEALIDTK